jgi:hypothetical protein
VGAGVSAEGFLYEGESLVVVFRERDGRRMATGITRFEEADGAIVRMRSYDYCPETMTHVTRALGLETVAKTYHQGAEVLPRMIGTTRLPWVEPLPTERPEQ